MLKKNITMVLVFSAFSIFGIGFVSAEDNGKEAKLEEGNHYFDLGVTSSSENNIKEFFSFYCHICFDWKEHVEGIKDKISKDISYERFPMLLNSKEITREAQIETAKMFVVAKVFQSSESFSKKMYEYLYESDGQVKTKEDVRRLAKLFDVTKYEDLLKTEKFLEGFERHKTVVNHAANLGVFRVLPAIVVNDRYLINSDIYLDKSTDEVIKLIEYLLNKPSHKSS